MVGRTRQLLAKRIIFIFIFYFLAKRIIIRETKIGRTMWNVKTRERRSTKRIEEEKPAGVSGMDMRKAFGSFRRRRQLNGERRLDKGIDMV